MNTSSIKSNRPFLKWPGNKFALLKHIKPLLPTTGRRLIEPFAGSAALTLNSDYQQHWINDCNTDLINVYRQLKYRPKKFIARCHHYFSGQYNKEQSYYQLRKQFNQSRDPFHRSVLFLYLNRHCYNGLCRYNSEGIFNVPFGRFKQPLFPDESLTLFVSKLKKTKLTNYSFEHCFNRAIAGDIIYCDPPYIPLSNTANFVAYHRLGFDMLNHQQLVTFAEKAAKRGVTTLISNHANQQSRQLYQESDLIEFPVRRTMSCIGNKRNLVIELIAKFQPSP